MTLPPELVDKVGLKVLRQLTQVPATEGTMLLMTVPNITQDEMDLLVIQLCKRSPAEIKQKKEDNYYFKRRRAFAVLWVMGVSWAKLSAIYDVQRQTVMQAANRILKADRLRLATDCSYEQAAAWNTKFWELDAEGLLLPERTPLDIAKEILETTEED